MSDKLKLKTIQPELLQKELQKLRSSNNINNSIQAKQNTVKKVHTPQEEELFAILRKLSKLYPKIFPFKGPRPILKKGIFLDLVHLFDNRTKLRKFFRWYTSSRLYYANHAVGAPRYDLNFKVVGYVTQKEIDGVKITLEQAKKAKK